MTWTIDLDALLPTQPDCVICNRQMCGDAESCSRELAALCARLDLRDGRAVRCQRDSERRAS